MDATELAEDSTNAFSGDTGPGLWSECLDRLYESVADEGAFASAVGAFRPFFGAQWSTFLTAPSHSDHASVHVAACGVPSASLVEYHSHFHLHDEWTKAGWAANAMVRDAAYAGSELVPPQRLKETYFYRSFLSRYGVADILCAILDAPSEGGPVAFVTFHRLEGHPYFERRHADALRKLAPHLRRALHLHRRLGPKIAVGATLHDVFMSMDAPMLFLDARGAIVDQNAAARALIEKSNLLQVSRQGLMVRTDATWKAVSASMSLLQESSAPSATVSGFSPGEGRLTLDMRRVHRAFSDRLLVHESVVLGSIRVQPDSVAGARVRYGLTAAESRVTRLLLAGVAAATIALQLGVATSTVRTHIRHLLEKTGTRRQAELVARLRD